MKQQIVILLSVDEMSLWDKSFVLVPKSNGKVRLCPHSLRLNQALIRPVHMGRTANGIFPKLTCIYYVVFTDISSRYHNLKLDETSSYFVTIFISIQ